MVLSQWLLRLPRLGRFVACGGGLRGYDHYTQFGKIPLRKIYSGAGSPRHPYSQAVAPARAGFPGARPRKTEILVSQTGCGLRPADGSAEAAKRKAAGVLVDLMMRRARDKMLEHMERLYDEELLYFGPEVLSSENEDELMGFDSDGSAQMEVDADGAAQGGWVDVPPIDLLSDEEAPAATPVRGPATPAGPPAPALRPVDLTGPATPPLCRPGPATPEALLRPLESTRPALPSPAQPLLPARPRPATVDAEVLLGSPCPTLGEGSGLRSPSPERPPQPGPAPALGQGSGFRTPSPDRPLQHADVVAVLSRKRPRLAAMSARRPAPPTPTAPSGFTLPLGFAAQQYAYGPVPQGPRDSAADKWGQH